MKNKIIYIFYPSFENGGIAKILIKLINFLLEKILKSIFIHKTLQQIILNIQKNYQSLIKILLIEKVKLIYIGFF